MLSVIYWFWMAFWVRPNCTRV